MAIAGRRHALPRGIARKLPGSGEIGMDIFVAGATGALGWPLCRRLAEAGHRVAGMTRAPEKSQWLSEAGIRPALCDVYDAENLRRLIQSERPAVVIHQLTDLPYGLPAGEMAAARVRNNRIRIEGTRNLLLAIEGLAVEYLLVQSIAFMYAESALPHGEDDGLASADLERFEASVREAGYPYAILRYGRLYGERTGTAEVAGPCRIEVGMAVRATLRCLDLRLTGTFNICEDRDYADNAKFCAAAGWRF
jgi:nucleoside-diphosphate-sugar epimerase